MQKTLRARSSLWDASSREVATKQAETSVTISSMQQTSCFKPRTAHGGMPQQPWHMVLVSGQKEQWCGESRQWGWSDSVGVHGCACVRPAACVSMGEYACMCLHVARGHGCLHLYKCVCVGVHEGASVVRVPLTPVLVSVEWGKSS